MNYYKHNNIRYWFDRAIKLWTLYTVDSDECQNSDAEYFANKKLLKQSYPQLKFAQ